MTDSREILPGIGYRGLVLGMTRDEVRGLLGEPTKEDTEQHDDKSKTVSWSFPDGSLEIDFCSDDDYKLGAITVADPDATVQGALLIGLTEKEFLAAAKKAGVGPIELEDEFKDIDARDFAWDDGNLTFWVSDGVLENVTVMPLYDKTGEIPQWPSR